MTDEYDPGYPIKWIPQSRRLQPPDPPSTKQPIETLRSGCPDPNADQRGSNDDYPPEWRRR